MNEPIAAAVNKALARNEVGAENLANGFRLLFLSAVGVLALVNAPSVERVSNEYNFGALAAAFLYGGAVFAFLKSRGYHPALKYATSFTDITIVHALLLLYMRDSLLPWRSRTLCFMLCIP